MNLVRHKQVLNKRARLIDNPYPMWQRFRCCWLVAMLLIVMPQPLSAATLTIEDGVTIKFGANAQLTVRDKLVAGKSILFTSNKDDSALGKLGLASQTSNLGDWLGLRLEKSAAGFGALTLNDLTIRYGGASVGDKPTAALTVRGWNPSLQNLLITDNAIGLRVLDSAAPSITGSSFLRNTTGIEATNSAPSIAQSQLAGNTTLAIDNKTPNTVITALGNWWGHASGPKEPIGNPSGQGDAITTGVNFGNFKSVLALYSASVSLAEPAAYYEQHDVLLDLSCINATEYRIAQNNTFANVTPLPLTDNRVQVSFTTSEGDGIKPIFVEFRGPNNTTAVVSLTGGILIDTQAPTVTLNNPANGSLISQPITVTATATDAAGISKVQLFLDGQLVATKTAAPYTYSWNTNNSTDGTHIIKAVATDNAGRTAEQVATITLARILPAADISGPTLSNPNTFLGLLSTGTTFTRSGTVSITASDPSGISRVDLLLDGAFAATATGSGTYSTTLNIDNVPNGAHTLVWKAIDSLGNVTTQSFDIIVAHAPPLAPVLSQPANGTSVRTANIVVSGAAKANSTVQLFNNAETVGGILTAGADGRFSTSLTLSKGNNQIQATATDQYGTGPASKHRHCDTRRFHSFQPQQPDRNSTGSRQD